VEFPTYQTEHFFPSRKSISNLRSIFVLSFGVMVPRRYCLESYFCLLVLLYFSFLGCFLVVVFISFKTLSSQVRYQFRGKGS